VLAEADEVVLVDQTPEALVQRLREGKVYPRGQVPAALNGFFEIENLQALREQADDLVDATVRVGRAQKTTYILMRTPTPRRGIGRLAEPIAEQLLRALPGVDVRLVAERSASG
jgi:K+-sensing histidine kinase KdpD